MFFYIGQKYTATVRGGVWRTETCEQCDRGYAYYGEIEAWGTGESPYMLDNSGAQRRAQDSARREFERYAAKAVFAVPCPHCGAYQQPMFRVLSRRFYKWMYNLGVTLIFLSFFVFLAATFFAPSVTGASEVGGLEIAIGGAATVLTAGAGIVLLIGRRVRQNSYDPNVAVPEEERLAIGRERALTAEQFLEMQKQAQDAGN